MSINTFRDENKAVSPVIGVILMVAITVILAAVIGTFVLDLGNSAVQQNPQAGVSMETNTNQQTISVTVTSMPNADSVTVSRSDESAYSASMSSVGDSVTVGDATAQGSENLPNGASNDDPALASGDKITVIATYQGNNVVIATRTY